MKPNEITSNRLLSNYLKININDLEKLIKNNYIITHDRSSEILEILQYNLPKKKKGFRVVYSPNSDTLTSCLKTLNENLKKIYVPNKHVHGFIKKRSIKTNASKHLAKKVVFKVDIRDFFGSINLEMVTETLKNYGFNEDISLAIAKIVTFEDKLVQGFHTSPTLANMCFNNVDLEIAAIDKNIEYTRYADDLYFSSNKIFNIEDKLIEILLKYGFNLNSSKTKYMFRGGKQYVTGLTVFDETQPRIPKYIKKNFRQEIYFITKYGYKGHILHKHGITNEEYNSDLEKKSVVDVLMSVTNSKLYGWLRYMNSVEPDFVKKCYLELNKRFKKS